MYKHFWNSMETMDVYVINLWFHGLLYFSWMESFFVVFGTTNSQPDCTIGHFISSVFTVETGCYTFNVSSCKNIPHKIFKLCKITLVIWYCPNTGDDSKISIHRASPQIPRCHICDALLRGLSGYNTKSSILFMWQLHVVVETGVHRENHRPVANHWQTLSPNVVSSTPRHGRGSNSQL